ncbi:MAG: hypothetical protein AAF416_19445 [Pseudomonadota bacterium]
MSEESNPAASGPNDAPVLTVAVPGVAGLSTIRAAIAAWDKVKHEAAMEILILSRPDESVPLPEGFRLIDIGKMRLSEARELAIREAKAGHVLIAEDHCLPEPGTLRFALERIAEGWDAIAPSLRPGNRQASAEGSIMIGYGAWLEPMEPGQSTNLPGHNVIIAREVLLSLGDELGTELILGALKMRRLVAEGRRMVLEPRWRMRHFDPPGFIKEINIFWCVGLTVGSFRSRDWPLIARYLFPLAAPLTAGRHLLRTLAHYWRAGRPAGFSPLSPLASTAFMIASGLGEAVGAVRGLKAVRHLIDNAEVKPVSEELVALSDAREAAEGPIGRVPDAA